ncbi:MAG: type II CAAX endopeptidase family protein [Saprospiraceae bacterium]
MRLVVLLALILAGAFLGAVLMAVLLISNGSTMADFLNNTAMTEAGPMLTRIILVLNHAPMFLLPAIAWALIYYKKQWATYLNLRFQPKWIYIIAGIAFLMVAYPLVAKFSEWNQRVDLPSWMDSMENQTAEILKKVLVMNTIGALLMNILVIGIIPGIGEELVFRGIIQKEFQAYVKNPYIAILISSIIFSALHLQFEGFLPRVVLGMILGLIYYWTGNLWVNIVVHAFNNGLQVLLTYFNPAMADQDLESSVPVKWYAIIISLVFTIALGYWFVQQHRHLSVQEDTASLKDINSLPEHE